MRLYVPDYGVVEMDKLYAGFKERAENVCHLQALSAQEKTVNTFEQSDKSTIFPYHSKDYL